jgi:hypothetical protein
MRREEVEVEEEEEEEEISWHAKHLLECLECLGLPCTWVFYAWAIPHYNVCEVRLCN